MSFNDPEAWGFCASCAFLVAVDLGRMLRHERGFIARETCNGSGWPPDKQPGPEAKPRRLAHPFPYTPPTEPTRTAGIHTEVSDEGTPD